MRDRDQRDVRRSAPRADIAEECAVAIACVAREPNADCAPLDEEPRPKRHTSVKAGSPCHPRLDRQSDAALHDFETAIGLCPSVIGCHLLSGGEDYLVTLRARDLPDFERVHRTELSRLPGVTRMPSLFALREVVARPVPPALFDEAGGAS